MQIDIHIRLDGTETALTEPLQRLLLTIAGEANPEQAKLSKPVQARGNGAKATTPELPHPPVDETPDVFTKPTEPVSKPKAKAPTTAADYDAKTDAEKGDIARSIILQVYGTSPEGKSAVQALRRTLKVTKLDDAPSEALLQHAVKLATTHGVELPAL